MNWDLIVVTLGIGYGFWVLAKEIEKTNKRIDRLSEWIEMRLNNGTDAE